MVFVVWTAQDYIQLYIENAVNGTVPRSALSSSVYGWHHGTCLLLN
jgi:hypothetical protein